MLHSFDIVDPTISARGIMSCDLVLSNGSGKGTFDDEKDKENFAFHILT